MLKKIAFPGLFLIVGVTIGAGSVELRHRAIDIRSKEVFEQRIRCKSIADKYARENSSDERAVTLQMVDFSSSSDTCVAAFHGTERDYRAWELVDLLSGKETVVGGCYESRNCGEGHDMKLDAELESAFKKAVDGLQK